MSGPERYIELGPGQLWWGPAGAPAPRPGLCCVCLERTSITGYQDEAGNRYCGRQHWEQGRPAPVVVVRDGTQDAVLLGGPSAGQRVVVHPHLNEVVIAVDTSPRPYIRGEMYPTTELTFAQVVYHRVWPPQHVDGRAVFTTTGTPHPDHFERVYRGARAAAPSLAPQPTVDDVLARINRDLEDWEWGPDAARWQPGDETVDDDHRRTDPGCTEFAGDYETDRGVRCPVCGPPTSGPRVTTVTIDIDTTDFTAALQRLTETLDGQLQPWQQAVLEHSLLFDRAQLQVGRHIGRRVVADRWLQAQIARAFDVPLAVVSDDPLLRSRHRIRSAYRRRQLARRRRRR